MTRAMWILFFTGCARLHYEVPDEPAAGSPPAPDAADAGTDAGPPKLPEAPRECAAPLVAEGDFCVGWLSAALLPDPRDVPAERVWSPWDTRACVRRAEVVHCYDEAADAWIVDERSDWVAGRADETGLSELA